MTPHDPDHDRLRTALGAYVLGALPADEAAELEAHLDGCPACRAERDGLLPAAAVLGELKQADPLPVEPAPAGLDALVLDRLAR
ncbi:MAG: Anti-sigma factor, partial [Nocardioides sp.]|nr:Anti-sigma factor [Nocardioides sp.]